MMEEVEEKLKEEAEAQSARRTKNNEAMLKLIELATQQLQSRP
jgi:hypothetical protein